MLPQVNQRQEVDIGELSQARQVEYGDVACCYVTYQTHGICTKKPVLHTISVLEITKQAQGRK